MQSHDWIVRTADDVIAAAQERNADPIICASGISPSGPVHLGNLRELTTQHFVAEEIKRRGVPCEHLLFWDDYDRLRKIPAGVPPDFAEHLGRPLTGVPDPWGEYPSWAERFATPVREAIRQLGMDIREISQTERYAAGAYTDHVVRAMRERDTIRDVLARYRTKGKERAEEEYWPYRVYCETCGRDTTSIITYDDASTALGYTCECGHAGDFVLDRTNSGKLFFKVDWPMRWTAVPVTFEAAGADHSSPGSTMTVGSELCRKVFGAEPPVYLGYAFVGIRGASKLSSSAGAVPTPADGLRVIETPILRWLYERRRPNQSITIDFGSEITRLYDEWDRLDDPTAYERATRTTTTELPQPAKRIPWRLLTSVLDLTAGDDAQLLRILRDVDADSKDLALAERRTPLEQSTCLGRRACAGRGADPRTRRARQRTPFSDVGKREKSSRHFARKARGRLEPGRAHDPRVRRPQAGKRNADRRATDRRAQAGPTRVLRARLHPAGQPRHRTAAPHPAPRARPGTDQKTDDLRRRVKAVAEHEVLAPLVLRHRRLVQPAERRHRGVRRRAVGEQPRSMEVAARVVHQRQVA